MFMLVAIAVLLADRLIFRALKRRMGHRRPSKRRIVLAFSIWGVLLIATGVCLWLLPLELIWVGLTLLVAAHFSWKLIMLG